jgi:hypothetical protein
MPGVSYRKFGMQKHGGPGHTLHVLHSKNGSWQELDLWMHTDANGFCLINVRKSIMMNFPGAMSCPELEEVHEKEK